MTRALLKNKRYILIGIVGLFLFAVASYIFTNGSDKRPNYTFDIPASGGLPSLKAAMEGNKELRQKVKLLLSYDTAVLFGNYRQVNSLTADVLFLWSGLTRTQLDTITAQEAIEFFIRRHHLIPEDEPVINNPILAGQGWPTLFNRLKAKILMQGQGYKIYDGVAYYNSEEDLIVVKGNLSQNFIETFAKFIKTQPRDIQPKYTNNFLAFVEQTKNLDRLNEEERKMISFFDKTP